MLQLFVIIWGLMLGGGGMAEVWRASLDALRASRLVLEDHHATPLKLLAVRCLALTVAERFSDAAALVRALEQITPH